MFFFDINSTPFFNKRFGVHKAFDFHPKVLDAFRDLFFSVEVVVLLPLIWKSKNRPFHGLDWNLPLEVTQNEKKEQQKCQILWAN